MNDDGRPGPTDAWVTLAALGRETTTIRLGTMVTPITFRWPGQLAIQVAQADAMSGGRVELGIGAGWYAAEHAAYGIPSPPPGHASRCSKSSSRSSPGYGPRPTASASTSTAPTIGSRTRPDFPSPCSGRDRRSSSAASAPSARPASLRPTPTSSTCRSCPSTAFGPRVRTSYTPRVRPRVAIPRRCGTRSPPKPASAQTMPSSAGARPRSAVTPTRCAAGGASGTVAEVVDRLNAWAGAGAEAAYLQIIDFDDLDQLELIAAEIAPHV